MKLSVATRISELLTTYPFLEDFLVELTPRYEMLRSKMARVTLARMATIGAAAKIGGFEAQELLRKIAAEIGRQAGRTPEVVAVMPPASRAERLQELKSIIRHLHDGGDQAEAQERFNLTLGDVEPCEIASMEEELVAGGLPVSEIQRLCDVHVGAFKSALDTHAPPAMPPGHPVHTYMAENRIIAAEAERLAALTRPQAESLPEAEILAVACDALEKLSGFENHYQRKENQLFPFLEKHGITGPPQVMWGVHDEIRAEFKAALQAARDGNVAELTGLLAPLARDLIEMIYKEEKILFPMSLETLTADEWCELKAGEDTLGYVLAQPAAEWPGADVLRAAPAAASLDPALLKVMTGELALEQLNLILTNLPVDLSFVDEHDTVRFYSEGPERIFPRSPAVIGRKVQNCHPPSSMAAVQDILDSFRAGDSSTSEFWIQLQGRFIHIRYFALRDAEGSYRGCLEVSQDVTAIRQLSGEKRLA